MSVYRMLCIGSVIGSRREHKWGQKRKPKKTRPVHLVFLGCLSKRLMRHEHRGELVCKLGCDGPGDVAQHDNGNPRLRQAQEGIILDHSNPTLITDVEVYETGMEAVHFRDGSSYNTIGNSRIHDTGKTGPGYGEGVYVGSAEGAGYNQNTHYSTIRNVVFGPNVAAEHVDIKERTIGTVVENCTFYGEGISGANYANSFIDVKGNNAVIRNNIGYQNGNGNIADAFQVHQVVSGWGLNNEFSHNTLYLTDPSVYVIGAYGSATATAIQNARTLAGNMYKGHVTVQ